jgi:hypothetical protein
VANRLDSNILLIPDLTEADKEEIVTLAFRFWLEREFRNGSPEEDFYRAEQEVRSRRPYKGLFLVK